MHLFYMHACKVLDAATSSLLWHFYACDACMCVDAYACNKRCHIVAALVSVRMHVYRRCVQQMLPRRGCSLTGIDLNVDV